jgi:uncharacterized protein YaiE (UPF0345 family)
LSRISGDVAMGAAGGADYQIAIPDTVLSAAMGDILASHKAIIGFVLPNSADWFRFATGEDFAAPGNTDLDYGISIAPDITAAMPEPGVWAMMLVGIGGLGVALRARRRTATATA